MANVTSNLDQVSSWLDQLANLIDFTKPGQDKTLGEDCLDLCVERFRDRALNEQRGANGQGWANNAPRYARRPDKLGKPVGVLSGEMLSDIEMQGQTHVAPHEAVRLYGTSDAMRDRASYFWCGSSGDGPGPKSGAVNQPPRPGLYELEDSDVDEVEKIVDEFVTKQLREP